MARRKGGPRSGVWCMAEQHCKQKSRVEKEKRREKKERGEGFWKRLEHNTHHTPHCRTAVSHLLGFWESFLHRQENAVG